MRGARELRDGWRNLSAATVGIGLGIASYPPVSSLFFHALETEFGWSKAAAAGALIALPITALVLPLAGFLVDRFSVRLVSGTSAAISVVSYLRLSHLGGDVKEFYAALIVLNVLLRTLVRRTQLRNRLRAAFDILLHGSRSRRNRLWGDPAEEWKLRRCCPRFDPVADHCRNTVPAAWPIKTGC